MKKRIISILLVGLFLVSSVSFLASCGTTEPTAPPAGPTAAPTAPPEGETLEEVIASAVANLEVYVDWQKKVCEYTTENAAKLDSTLTAAKAAVQAATDKEAAKAAYTAEFLKLAAVEGTAKKYTLRDYTSASPSTWNPHSWVTNGDQVIMSYAEMGLVDVAMKSEGEYMWVYEMATAVEDITAQATAEQKAKWNIKDGQVGRMYKVTLNPLAKWENGTPINADTYVYSMKQLLDSKMKNSRSDLYWSGENAIYNADIWFNQDKKGEMNLQPISGLTYKTIKELIDAGKELYVDMAGFWGVQAGETGFAAITDETKYRDEAVPEGEAEDYVSGKYIFETYLADGAPYNSYASSYVYYNAGIIPEISWEDVGFYKTGEYEFVWVCKNEQSMFNFLISAGSNWIVYEELYEAGKKEEGGLIVTDYATAADKYMAYGPYKLASFEAKKQFALTKNENWYGYTDGKHVAQYMTTDIVVNIITDHNTEIQMFLKGELDSLALTSDDLAEYGASDYLLKTPETYSMKFSFNTSLEVLKKLEETRKDGKNVQILSNTNFIKAMSWCFDRETWTKEVTAGELPQVALLSNLYFYDVENDPTSVYRNSKQAMKGIVEYYGLEYGEGKRYETLKEAYNACTGFDMTQAKELFNKAYTEAIAAGIYTEGQEILIHVGAAKGAVTDELTKQEKKFNEFLAAGTAGTPFEGKVKVVYEYNINDRYGDCSDGVRECCYGGLGGAAFYPYRCFNSYIDESQAVGGKITEGNYDPKAHMITVTYDFDGDGTAETVEDSAWNWNASITEGGKYFTAPHDLKLTVLSAIECGILDAGHCFPITVTAIVSMNGMKVKQATTNYNIMYGYGGIRLMTFNYSDTEWDAFVQSQGGTLNYK